MLVKSCRERRTINLKFSSFLNALDRITAHTYVPTTQDILMLRITTTGIIEVKKFSDS